MSGFLISLHSLLRQSNTPSMLGKTIFEMTPEEILNATQDLEHNEKKTVQLFKQILMHPNYSEDDKKGVLDKISQCGNYHILVSILVIDQEQFIKFFELSDKKAISKAFNQLKALSILDPFPACFKLMFEICQPLEDVSENEGTLLEEFANCIPKDILQGFHNLITPRIDPHKLGKVLSIVNIQEFTYACLCRFFESEPSIPRFVLFATGVQTTNKGLRIFTCIFNNREFHPWVMNIFRGYFHRCALDLQMVALCEMPKSTRAHFLNALSKKGFQLGSLFRTCVDNKDIDFDLKVSLSKEVVQELDSSQSLEFLRGIGSQPSTAAVLYLLLGNSIPKLKELLDQDEKELKVFFNAGAVSKVEKAERESLMSGFQDHPQKLATLLYEICVPIKVIEGGVSKKYNLNFETMAEEGNLLPLDNPLNDELTLFKIYSLIQRTPNIFLFFAGFAEENIQNIYLKFLPYLSEQQIVNFAACLYFYDMISQFKFLEALLSRLTDTKCQYLIESLPEETADNLFSMYRLKYEAAIQKVSTEFNPLKNALQELKSENYNRERPLYETRFKVLQDRLATLEAELRALNGTFAQAFKKFYAEQTKVRAFNPSSEEQKLFDTLLGVHKVSRQLLEISRLVNEMRPVPKRKRGEPTEDVKLQSGKGILKGIKHADLEPLGFNSVEELSAVGICSQEDLYVIGLTMINTRDHRKILEKYLSQNDLVDLWKELGEKKNIWNIHTLVELELLKNKDGLFNLKTHVNFI